MQSNGTPTFNFGGCNNVYIRGGYLSDMNFTINSRAVLIAGARIGMDNPLQISGAEIVIVGCDVGPQVVLTPGVQGAVIGPNSYNTLPVDDNSGNGRNLVYHWNVNYTPTLGADGGGASANNGVMNGRWSRQGNLVHVVIEFTVGGTTSLGTGPLYFTLPADAPNAHELTQACGTLYLTRNGVIYTAVCFVPLPSSGQRVYMIRDTSGFLTATTPGAGSSIGDQYRLEFTYSIGV